MTLIQLTTVGNDNITEQSETNPVREPRIKFMNHLHTLQSVCSHWPNYKEPHLHDVSFEQQLNANTVSIVSTVFACNKVSRGRSDSR